MPTAAISLKYGRTVAAGPRDGGIILRLIQDWHAGRSHIEYDLDGHPFQVGAVDTITLEK